MRHARLAPGLLVVSVVVGLRGASAEDEPTLFRPRPRAEWAQDLAPTGTLSLAAIGPVVVVAVVTSHGPDAGTGLVLRGGDERRPALVLTCGHVVRFAREVRVGTFGHSYDPPDDADPRYRELPATVVARAADVDLALLSVPAHGLRAFVPEGRPPGGAPVVVSVAPFGRPTMLTSARPTFVGGQSGSPVLDGDLLGIARGNRVLEPVAGPDAPPWDGRGTAWLERPPPGVGQVGLWVERAAIEAFLSGVADGPEVLEAWRVARSRGAPPGR